MNAFVEIVVSNSVLVIVLAVIIAIEGRFWKNPAGLHLLWLLVLVKFVTPPLLTVPIHLPARPIAVEAKHTAAPSPSDELAFPAIEKVADSEPKLAPPSFGQKPIAAADKADAAPLPTPISWLVILAGVWGIGIVGTGFWQAFRILRFHKLLQSTQPATDEVLSMAAEVGKQLGLRRFPQVRTLPVRVSPMVLSVGLRPQLLLPVELFKRLEPTAQRSLLAHELAHVRRKDHLVRLLELLVTTLFWWHPVGWWACWELQQLEDLCCDAMVVGIMPGNRKVYATALMNTLDFLCDGSIAAPLGITATQSSALLTRRIAMLKNKSFTARLNPGRLVVVSILVAFPMALAVVAAPPAEKSQQPPNVQAEQRPDANAVVQTRAVHKFVNDFPEKTDLSTPESATVALHRTFANPDPKSWLDLSAWAYTDRDVADIKRKTESHQAEFAKNAVDYGKAEIIEVLTYRDGLAEVISKLGGNRTEPYSVRFFVRINGSWKNFGENRAATPDQARRDFEHAKDYQWAAYCKVLDGIAKGNPVRLQAGDLSSSQPKRVARIAPGEELGISVEKADLMGRVEWAMMHGGRDITARKTIEWGEVEKDKDGNRKIRYKFDATIWGKDVYTMNKAFTFDAKGNILNMEDVAGFPKKKVEKPVNVSTQEGMKELVERFFRENFHDITSRESMEWGEVIKATNGNSSIRYKYRAEIWDKDTKIMNEVFTFDPKGEFVSVKDVEGFPQNK